jgi:hypothetical protein
MMMSTDEDRQTEGRERVFTPEQEIEMRRLAAERILAQLGAEEVPLLSVNVEDITSLMNAVQWGLGKEIARQTVTRWVKAEPRSAIQVIRAYKGQAISLESGLPVESAFFRAMYDSMMNLVDAEVLVASLTTLYGDELAVDVLPVNDDDLRLAKQFMAMHQQVVEAYNAQQQNGEQSG